MKEGFRKMLSELKLLELPQDEYVVFGSGPMTVRGIREGTHDIDVVVTYRLYKEKQASEGWKTYEEPGRYEYIRKGNIELWKDWGPGEWKVEDLIAEAEQIEGVNFVSLEKVLKWKKILNREKDKIDVRLIEDYIKHKKK